MKVVGIVCCVIGFGILLSGCTQLQNELQMSLTEIQIGDMPTEEFRFINVTFSNVTLYSNETGWVSFLSEPTTFDLLALHMDNLTAQLGLEEIEIGNYTKLWIVVDNAIGVLNATNETVVFDVPSGTLKIQHLFNIQEGNNTIIVDINLDNSILAHHGMYKLLPVISGLDHECGNGSTIKIRDQVKLKEMTENRKPTIDILVNNESVNHITVDINETIVLNASETFDAEGDTITFSWDFDEGTNGTGAVVNHSFAEKGTYQVTLTASDGELEDTAKITVTVKESGGP
jgi:hypothetical protein